MLRAIVEAALLAGILGRHTIESTNDAAVATIVPQLSKLGLYDYMVQESTPIVFNGALLMIESLLSIDPQWAGHWNPAYANCSGYFRVRNQASGVVITNLTSSCNYAFGTATVYKDDAGLDTLLIFGTAWSGPYRQSGPCAAATTCVVSAFSSVDPALQVWNTVAPLLHPGGSTYNVDVTRIGAELPSGTPLSGAQWIMQTEGKAPTFFICTGSDPLVASCWTPLPSPAYSLDKFAGHDIGSCPSIRFDAARGLFYVLTGGDAINVLRSGNLTSGSWVLGKQLLVADAGDCAVASPPFGGWFVPDANATAHMAKCGVPRGFGFDSDVDLTEIVLDGTRATLVQYGTGDQKTFGFSNLALAHAPMFDLLASMF